MLVPGDDLIADRFQSSAWYEVARSARVIRGISEVESDHMGFFAEFVTDNREPIVVKAGISFVDIAGAGANLEKDLPDWNMEGVRSRTRGLWREELSRIEIEGATAAQKTIFATALYHACIDPRKISDFDGRYHAADGVIRTEQGYSHRTIFSGWDVYRAELPLMTILNPDLVNDQICSLLDLAKRSGKGYLERSMGPDKTQHHCELGGYRRSRRAVWVGPAVRSHHSLFIGRRSSRWALTLLPLP